MFARSPGKPACRDHHRCTNLDVNHWKAFDHPSTHPFIHEDIPDWKLQWKTPPPLKAIEQETPALPKEPLQLKAGKHSRQEPLEIGESVTTIGSRGDEYTIKRHADKNNMPFYWCTCPSRKYHGTKGDNTCKHIDELRSGKDVRSVVSTVSTRTTNVPPAISKSTFQVALAEKYDPSKHNPAGMLFMEKYDGFYAHFDVSSGKMFTRAGNQIFIPDWFTKQLPNMSVTGELYGGKGKFNEFQGLFGSNDTQNPRWMDVTFIIFDVVDDVLKPMLFKDRMQLVRGVQAKNVKCVDIVDCVSITVPVRSNLLRVGRV